jgi:uncharacterized protein YheU (UPF0270 family)
MPFPLTPEAAKRAQERSLEVRKANTLERMRRSEVVHRVVSETADLAPAALDAALRLVERLGTDGAELEIETTLDAQRLANVAEIVHRISRLASGQSTANVAHATTDDERRARLAELRSRMAQHDDGTPGNGDVVDDTPNT